MDTPAFRRFLGIVLGSGALLWGWSTFCLPWMWPGPTCLLVLALTSAWAEMRSLYVSGYGMVNFGEGLYFAAALRFGGPPGALLSAVIGCVSDCWKKRPRGIVLFNLGWSLLTFSAVGLATRALPGPWLATLTYAFVAAGLQAACQTFEAGISFRTSLRHQLQGMRLGIPSALVLGVFGSVLFQLSPWAIVLALFPVEIFTAYVRVQTLHEQLLATQTQLQVNSRQAALGVLTAGVAHEINNPLAAMATSVHLLERGALTPQNQMCVGMLKQGIERCQSITQRMLLYSRPPENRPTHCTLAEVVEDTLLFCSGRMGSIRVEVAPEIAETPVLACDPGLLVQVLTNLLSNALDVARRQIRMSLAVPALPGCIALLVSDDGAGIPDALLSRIWEPFFTTKAVGSGTGLGLSISLSLMRSVGGDLSVEQTSSQGTTFQVLLPR